jgi:hypothetical protein
LKPTSLSAGWFFIAALNPLDTTGPFWKISREAALRADVAGEKLELVLF